MVFAHHPIAGVMSLVRLRGRSDVHTDRLSSDRFKFRWVVGSVGFDDGSVSLGFALRGTLPLRAYEEGTVGANLRDVEPPPEREAELSTLWVPRSSPSLYARWHGIVQHRQRIPTSVWGRTLTSSGSSTVSVSSLFYVVSILLYAAIYVVLPLLPTFLDPPWVSLSHHPTIFDQHVVLSRTFVGLHYLDDPTSTFKTLPALSPWQSSALYYDCCYVPSVGSEHVHLGSVVLLVTTSNPLLNHGGSLLRGRRQEAVWHHWAHGNVMGGSNVLGAYSWRSSLMEKILCGEKVILIWIKRCFVYLLGLVFSWRVWGVLPRGRISSHDVRNLLIHVSLK